MPVHSGPPIYGTRVVLRSVSESEVLIAGHDSDLELARDARCFRKALEDGATHYFGLCTEGGDLIGHVILQREDSARQVILGIHIFHPERRHQGYGSNAVAAACSYCFRDLDLERVVLRVHESNRAARRCYGKCGFKCSGRAADDPSLIVMVLDRCGSQMPPDGSLAESVPAA